MLKIVERWFVIAMLLYLSGAVIGFIWPDSETNLLRPESVTALFVIQSLFYATTFVLIALRWNSFAQGAWAGRWMLCVPLFAVCSSLWSADPAFTFRRSLVLLGTTAFGIYVGSRFTLDEQLGLFAKVFALIMVFSFIFAVFLPHYGIDHEIHGGDWLGVFSQKNLLGKAMIIAALVFASSGALRWRALRWACIGGAVALTILSASLTSEIVLLALFLIAPGYRLLRTAWRARIPLVIGLFCCVAAVVGLVAGNSAVLLAILGRDETLTGRTEIWQLVWMEIQKHMILGYGFDAFWAGVRGESANVILALGWVAKHSHNGFLDLWLELGFIGLALFACSYFLALRDAALLFVNHRGKEAYWPLHYLAFMLLYHVVEGPILRQNSLYWALYSATVVCVSTARLRQTSLVFEAPARRSPAFETQPDYLPG